MVTERKFIDFNLELRDLDLQANTFKVAVLPSPAVGETQQAISVPYRYAEFKDDLDSLDRKRIYLEDLIQLGIRLADRLLPTGQVRELFQAALTRAGRDGGVRLRLLIREPKLAQLPWEFSYLQLHAGEADRRHFLVLNPQLSMVRHEALPEEHPSLTTATPERLRLVAAFANPADGYTRLNLKREKGVLERALRDLNADGVTIEWEPFIEDATVENLARAFLEHADLFHFAGHGGFQAEDIDPQTREPVGVGKIALVKDQESREPFLLAAGELALQLQQAGVRVAVLGACESGRRDGINIWTGIAPALVERGVPVVVAMQYEVLDDHAIAFNQMFYTSLAAGLSVDEAVSAGRLAMLGISNEDDVEWGVPVLYLRSPNGIIFPRLAARQSETAAQIRHVVQQTVETIAQGGEVIGIVAKQVSGSFEVSQRVKTVKGRLVGAQFETL